MVAQLSRLPSIGQKSAQRLAYHIIGMPLDDVRELAAAIYQGRKAIRYCSVCGNYAVEELCDICADESRSPEQLCVVRDPRDVAAIERMRDFTGRYHVLHGTLSPMEGIGPGELKLAELMQRVENGGVEEVLIATSSTVAGEATASYVADMLQDRGLRLSRLACGIPMGMDIKYADEHTLSRAIASRQSVHQDR